MIAGGHVMVTTQRIPLIGKPTLTIIVPAFNSSTTLERCLNSFLDRKIMRDIEVVIVDDGSTDDTTYIARNYEDNYPCFRMIRKENGGHGSVINYAVKHAIGKYIKVIDSDDYVQSKNLSQYIEYLKDAYADIVFTNFRTIDSRNGFIREYRMNDIAFNQETTFDEFWRKKKVVRHVCNFHGITYRTDFYRNCGIKLSEGIFYEDQEYSTLPIAFAKTVLPLDLFLYEYKVGSMTQSVSDVNQVNNLHQMESVLWKVINETPESLTESLYDYFLYKKREMLLSYYSAALVKNINKRSGRHKAKQMRERVRQEQPDLHKASQKQYDICVMLSYLGINGETMAKAQKSELYRKLAKLVH